MSLTVKHLERMKFEVECRSHKIVVDQPKSSDGTDQGMNPIELFNAGLASCAAFYAITFLSRRINKLGGLEVKSSWNYTEHPHRVGEISLTIRLPCSLSENERKGLIGTAEHCAVKNSLEYPPKIQITLKDQ